MVDVEETLNGILAKVRQEQGYENGQTIIKEISSHGANYTSLLYLVKLSETGKDDLNLFVKVAVTSEQMRKITPYEIFETENLAYKELLKVYKKLEDKFNVPTEHRLVTPKFYACSEVYLKEALVLEDLTASGYTTFDRFKSIDWEYASRSVENLAKLHALSISCSIENPDEFQKIQIFNLDKSAGSLVDYLKVIIENALKVTKEENRDRLSTFVTNIMETVEDGRYFKPIRRAVIAHGDYRPSNLMHKVKEDGTVDIISVDYQTLQQGNPIIDLMYFIFNGSDKKFREKYFRKTLDHYYAELCAALRRLKLDPNDIYPKDDFEYELKQVLPYGLIAAMFCLLIVTVDEEDAPKVTKDINVTDFAINPNTLYMERLNDIIDDYIEMGLL